MGKSVLLSLPWDKGRSWRKQSSLLCPQVFIREGRAEMHREGRENITSTIFFILGSASCNCTGGEILGKAVTKSHRQIIGPDFYRENRPLPCNSLSTTSEYNRACSGRLVIMSPVFSWSDHRKQEKSLWDQMSGWR